MLQACSLAGSLESPKFQLCAHWVSQSQSAYLTKLLAWFNVPHAPIVLIILLNICLYSFKSFSLGAIILEYFRCRFFKPTFSFSVRHLQYSESSESSVRLRSPFPHWELYLKIQSVLLVSLWNQLLSCVSSTLLPGSQFLALIMGVPMPLYLCLPRFSSSRLVHSFCSDMWNTMNLCAYTWVNFSLLPGSTICAVCYRTPQPYMHFSESASISSLVLQSTVNWEPSHTSEVLKLVLIILWVRCFLYQFRTHCT